MKRMHWILAATILILSSGTSSLRAAVTCSVSDYQGSYAYFSVGALLQLPPQGAALIGPFAQAGTLTSDGQGNLTLTTTASYNGIVLPGNTTATYTVTPECAITFNVFLPDPLNVTAVFTGMISHNVRQVSLMITNPQGSVLPAQQNKQDLRFCGTSDFSGAYQIDLGGSIVAPKAQAGLFHRIGRLVADGNGSFTATSTADYNGGVVQENFQGTYSVNSDCFVNLSYTDANGNPATIVGPLSGHGEEASVLVAVQGWAVAGNLRAQQ
jgi:hypothetical protein